MKGIAMMEQTEQRGIDRRQRGWFWGPNEWVTQWAPLIGLDGIGLLNTYNVWCDQKEGSETAGYAFPSQEQEATFYGLPRHQLRTIVSILKAVNLLQVESRPLRRQVTIRGKSTWTTVTKNFYVVTNRDRDLTFEDVLAVLALAERNEAVFRRIAHIFKPDFAPVDGADRPDGKINPWYSLLPRLRPLPLWQRLEARAAQRARAYARRAQARQKHPSTTGTVSANGSESPKPPILSVPKGTVGSTMHIAAAVDPQKNNHSSSNSSSKVAEAALPATPETHRRATAIFASFAQAAGLEHYEPSARDQRHLHELWSQGYNDAEIISAITRAVNQAHHRGATPRSFAYCVPAVRDFPPGAAPLTNSEAVASLPRSLRDLLRTLGLRGRRAFQEIADLYHHDEDRVQGWVQYVLEHRRQFTNPPGFLLDVLRAGDPVPEPSEPEESNPSRRYISGPYAEFIHY